MTDNEPTSAADSREEPYYIESACESCGTELVLYDDLPAEKIRESDALGDPEFYADSEETWYDEWVCPDCLDGVRMDWPEEQFQSLVDRVEEEEFEPL